MLWRKAALAGSLAPGRGGQRSTAQQHTAASENNEKTERVEPASKTSKKARRNAQERPAGMVKLVKSRFGRRAWPRLGHHEVRRLLFVVQPRRLLDKPRIF